MSGQRVMTGKEQATRVAEKQAIRAEMLARRKALSSSERALAGDMAAAMLFDRRGLAFFPRFHFCASYLSTAEEFPTEAIHLALFQAQVLLSVPRYSNFHKAYRWAPLSPGAPLRLGPHRIWEPRMRLLAPTGVMEVALIPGLAFDTRGGRLGYGAGVYDRLLTKLRPGTLRVGLAFDCQVLREPLPQESHDLLMDYVVTESHWIDCRRARSVRRETNG